TFKNDTLSQNCYKAQSLYPDLDGLNQADDEIVKRQYKNLALLLHPDKTDLMERRRLVLHAWSLLSDRAERFLYDERRMQKNHHQVQRLRMRLQISFGQCAVSVRHDANIGGILILTRPYYVQCGGKTFIATEQIPRAVKKTGKTYNVLFGYCR
ncbi:LOW QUALITY PROTEIN: hypothetical protein HID58_056782, partial [Brassica napus]